MSILSPRNRLVSFRLSQREYEELQDLCLAQRARSLSDFVRDSMCRMIHQPEPARSGGYSADAARTLFEVQPMGYGRQGAIYPQQESPMQSISALTDMLLTLHRRTEALDRQLNRLMFLMRQETPQPAPDGREDGREDSEPGAGAKVRRQDPVPVAVAVKE